tara:strand:- start:155 stop:1243 length:1089 start_codon:yes stop_codon:yes gene_type:complete
MPLLSGIFFIPLMKKVDTIIVGMGIAGICYAETLHQNKKSFYVIDNDKKGSSKIAAGIFNPTVLKRYNMTWNGKKFHRNAIMFFKKIENKYKKNIIFNYDILKAFSSFSDQNNWAASSNKPNLREFLDCKIQTKKIEGLITEFGYGLVKKCGRISTVNLINEFKNNFKENYIKQDFDFTKFDANKKKIVYDNLMSDNIVFCEGFNINKNPFFKKLPITGTKGEFLIVKISNFNLNKIIKKSSIFIMPLENQYYWVGATYDNSDKKRSPTQLKKQWLIDKLESIITKPYKIVEHKASIRPSTTDRRPIIGPHPKYKNIYLLNGLGSRGVLLAPTLSSWLYNNIYKSTPIPKEADINRFKEVNI